MREKRPGERRRSGRFQLQAGVQIAIPAVHGEVLEMSQAGLAFAYRRERGHGGPRGPASAILFGNGVLYLSGCVIVPVWEAVAPSPESGGTLCCCGVRFYGLRPGQIHDLGRLIRTEALL